MLICECTILEKKLFIALHVHHYYYSDFSEQQSIKTKTFKTMGIKK